MKKGSKYSSVNSTLNSSIDSTSKSAINRKDIEISIFNFVEGAGKPVSTEDIARALGKSWHTIIRYCLDLDNKGKLTKLEIGRISLWQIKK